MEAGVFFFFKAIAESWSVGFSSRPGKSLLHRHRMAARVALRSTVCAREFVGWSSWLKKRELDGLLQVNPHLVIKPLRPYMASDWNVARRIKVLKATLEFVGTTAGASRELMAGQTLSLVTLSLPEVPSVSIRLAPTPNKEGELTLSVYVAGFEEHVARGIFSLDRLDAGQYVMRIACVQGNKRAYEFDRGLEKSMHGLRPKALVVFVLQEIARYWGMAQIYGIGRTNHVFATKHALSKLLGKDVLVLQMDYDSLWEELGGVRQADGWYQLPIVYPHRQHEEIKPNKRSMYKKRYALMDQIAEQIGDSLGSAR